MYLTRLKTLLVEATELTFNSGYIEPDFRDLHVSIEYPQLEQNYPGIWVDYNPIGPLQIMGIAHQEHEEPGDDGTSRAFTRWRFQGEASFTLFAMNSFERDRLHDEMVRVLAFGRESSSTSEFRAYIENNEYLGLNMDFDEVAIRGYAASVGTPWQTDEMIYEVEIAMEIVGDFVSDSQGATLVPLEEIRTILYHDQEPDPTTGVDGEWQ